MKRFCFLIIFLIVTITPIFAQNSTFEQANRDYNRGDYKKALGQYLNIVYKDGKISPEICYNIAQCYSQSGEKGRQLAWLLRGRKYAPRDRYIAEAIAQNTNKIQYTPIIDSFTLNETGGLALILIFCVSIIAIFAKIRGDKKDLFWCYITIWSIILICGAIFATSLFKARDQYGVVVTPEAQLRTVQDYNSTPFGDLPEGTYIKISGKSDGWIMVALPNGNEGWLPEKEILIP